MRKNRWVWCCAMVALVGSWLLSNGVAAQENPFGASSGGGAQDAAAATAEPTPAEAAPEGGGDELGMGQGEVATVKSPTEFCHCVGQDGGPTLTKIKQALAAPLRSHGLEFTETPLSDVMRHLQDDFGIPIQLDAVALDAVGINPDEQVTVSLHNISLQSALRLMLKRLQLTYLIQDEVLVITTPDEAEKQLVTCIYDVRDLVDGSKDSDGLKSLVDTILSTIHTETWAPNGGGEAEIRSLKPGLLVISQTQAVHGEVRGLLSGIRQVRQKPVTAATAAALPHQNEVSPAVAASNTVTRHYLLQINQPPDKGEVRTQIRSLITQSLPDEQWDGRLGDGQPVVLAVLPDRVVLRQTPEVQEKVQSLLVDSGLTMPTTAEAGAMGMGGGYGGGFFSTGSGARGFSGQTDKATGVYGGSESQGMGRAPTPADE